MERGVGGGEAFNGPEGIATDSSGNVYVADTGNKMIQVFDYNGNFKSQFEGPGAGLQHRSGWQPMYPTV